MEETPEFDLAADRLKRFLAEQGWPTGLMWRLEEDVVRLAGGGVVVPRRPLTEAVEAAREHYETGRGQGLGVSLEVSCEVDGLACATIYWTADPTEAEYRMMPERGLKLSVATPHRRGRSVGAIVWWFARRQANKREAALRRATLVRAARPGVAADGASPRR